VVVDVGVREEVAGQRRQPLAGVAHLSAQRLEIVVQRPEFRLAAQNNFKTKKNKTKRKSFINL